MGCGVKCVDNLLTRSFYKLGVQIGHTPGYFLIIPVLLTLLCVTGYHQIHYQMDPEYLFSPQQGPGKTERAIVETYFKMNYTSRFNPTRITRPGRFGRVIVIPKHGSNMLSVEVWKELRVLDGIIKNATIVFGEEQRSYTYEDICARWVDHCFENDILNLDHIMEEVVNKTLNLTFPIMFNPVTWDAHTFPVYFGGTVVDDDGIIISVPSLQLAYFVNADTKTQDARGAVWEEAFLAAVGKAEDSGMFKYISTARFASRTLDIELEKNTQGVVPFFGSTFVIMAVFSVLTCMMVDWVRSKPLLGLLGNVSAAMGTIAGFGLAMYCGIDFIGINLVSPLLMCSIGIDDTFVMLAAWRRTPVTMSVPERMGHTMSDAAVSITITSVTDMVSLWIGMLSPFPSIQIFCLYSSFAVGFIFLWHITFFAACMVLAGYAEHDNRHSILCIKVKPVSLSGKASCLYRIFCTGGINPKDPDNPKDNPDNAMMVFFRDSVAWCVNQWPFKVIVLLVFGAYISGAIYGLTTLQEGLQRRKLSRADSYSIEFYDREDFYFREFPYRMQVILSGELNYSDPLIQDQIENLTRTFEASPYISTPLYTESWLRSFVSYVKRNQDYLNVSIDTEDSFIKTLNELWLFKPNPFSLDVKFNDAGTRIIASRFMIQAVNISDGNMEKDMVRDLRRICQESHLNVSVFHPYFVFFDQFELVRPTSIQSMIVGATIMMIISYIFIPKFACSLWVAFCIISIEIGVAGYMALWDVNLDCISMINLIMCIGYSVDFTAHICYAYMSSKEERVEDRVKECLYSLGLPIFQGSVSTILGVAALIFAQSYIFLVFFKMIFLVIFFGALHGMFLLPVLLSWFGPGACSPKKSDLSRVEKTFPHPYCIPHPSLHPMSQMNGNGKHFGVPLHGMTDAPRLVMSTYNGNIRGKFIVEGEKDLGLGTSGEDSSESSSSKSQRRRQEVEDDEVQRRRYVEGWRKSSVPNSGSNRSPLTYHNGGYMSEEDSQPWRGHPASNQNRPRAQHYSPHHGRPYPGDGRYP
ncbi:patched domain-containing protein 3-like [Macrosteles quadrilineatus]|uniref:patched domain-containing protein 3-like n=1 Tax=Macrosteles quadrilineatus TaxID=74068 RepID=UPI0023E270CD|nr:patched domain-containing protein 3-like [Macrosteles quadrilineatus]